MMKELRAIGNKLNQIVARANATGHIDQIIFQSEADQLRQTLLDIQAAVTSPEKREILDPHQYQNHRDLNLVRKKL